ncbi:sulfite exporter TauE/SafE family protein [Flavisolibacter nicotianae]|uniref:sulfite exporter TauE/SafE family protein n=1 Tax=Flavisolibacter nicotianae TaxID=2364882 RepID=UPI001969152A|nr:TSUP family transporter [Flavisolibacter nicotianae]
MAVEWMDLFLLCAAAFCAGFVDAIVGGGGLIQLPAALVILPHFPVASVIGSLKIPSFSGTVFAAWQYVKKVSIDWWLLTIVCVLAFLASYSGSLLLTQVSNGFMKPVILVVLTIVAVYTYTKKDFGQSESHDLSFNRQLAMGVIISLLIGFYDGFIGPGAGSFFILAFIALLHFDFLHASAHAKMVNLATNLGSVTLFLIKGKIIWLIALPMAAANALGGFTGAKLAIARGNRFIRIFFLVIIVGILIRFCWDVFVKK